MMNGRAAPGRSWAETCQLPPRPKAAFILRANIFRGGSHGCRARLILACGQQKRSTKVRLLRPGRESCLNQSLLLFLPETLYDPPGHTNNFGKERAFFT